MGMTLGLAALVWMAIGIVYGVTMAIREERQCGRGWGESVWVGCFVDVWWMARESHDSIAWRCVGLDWVVAWLLTAVGLFVLVVLFWPLEILEYSWPFRPRRP